VLRENRVGDRFEALRHHGSALIGRDEELELLTRRWTQAKTGEGRVVLVWGEPGIGKSHLASAFAEGLEGEAHATLRFFCSPYRTEVALHPVIAHLEASAGLAPGDSDALERTKLQRLLDSPPADAGLDASLFAELLAIRTRPGDAALSLSAQRRKELLLERFLAYLVRRAARAPVLVVVEDAHWIDPTTRDWIDAVIERARSLPMLLIMTYRPEFQPSWLGQSHVTALTLNRLGSRDNAALVKRIAGGRDLPAALLDQILERTDGVPLYIEELTKSVLESGVLAEENGVLVLAGPLPALAVPSSLQASLVARLDRMASARALVQTSAALGREFSYALLKAVSGLDDAELEPLLEQLVASGLAHQRGTVPFAEYVFKHALVQDAAYETMLKSQRARIHARIAEVLEREFPEVAARQPDILAHHCREAGLAEKSIDFSIRATHLALERSAGIEAQAQVERAMGLLSEIGDASLRQALDGRLHGALGDALTMTRGFASPDVRAACSRARKLLDEARHPLEALRALCGMFNFHLIRSESPQGLELVAALLKRPLDPLARNVIHFVAGTTRLHIGNFHASIEHLETALSLYDERASQPIAFVAGYHLRSFTLIWLGLGQLYVGRLARAAETIAAAVEDARSRRHPFTLVSALLAQARFFHHTGNLEGAIAVTEEGAAIAAEQRSPYHLSRANVLRGVNLVESGKPDEGIAVMESALIAHRNTGANFLASYNLSRLAEAHARTGRYERAKQLADEAIRDVRRSGERWWEAEANRLRGEILLLSDAGKAGEAQKCFGKALSCARAQDARLWELHAARSLADLWMGEGRRIEARELLAPVYAKFDDGFETPDLARCRETLRRTGVKVPPRGTHDTDSTPRLRAPSDSGTMRDRAPASDPSRGRRAPRR
jgi:tetratricopeptide (TPR) repeat protein